MEYLSVKQQEVLDRDTRILDTSRRMLLSHGYYGMTMDRIASACDCPKGTMYQRFTCKEDIMAALALECSQRRADLMRRAATFPGPTRLRMGGVGEAMGLYERLNPDDSTIIHLATGPIREKASAQRAIALREMEHGLVDFVEGILSEAIAHGELELPSGASIQEMAFALWSLVDGGYRLNESDTPQQALGIEYPVRALWVIYNRLADAYGWRPFFADYDWEEAMAEIRRAIFPEEAQQLYGEGCWYGDAGAAHPGEVWQPALHK